MIKPGQLSAALIILYVASMSTPDIWSSALHFGEVPLGAIIMAALCCLMLLELFRTPRKMSFGFLAGVAALILMTANGVARGNVQTYSLKFFVADIYAFAAFLTGYGLARVRRHLNNVALFPQIAVTAAVAIVATYIALFAGTLVPILGPTSDRMVTQSIYIASAILLIVLPLASLLQSPRKTIIMLAIAAATSLLSATRSMLILTVLSGALCVMLRRHRFDAVIFFRSVVGLAIVVGLSFAGMSLLDSAVFHRFTDTRVSEEARYIEISLFWPQISGDLAAGQGMGSRFLSNIVVQGNPLASAPHIGIVTFLMKGGIAVFVACAVAPFFMAIGVLFSSKRSCLQRGAAASAVMFIALACLSGGWDPLQLFGFGMSLSIMADQAEAAESSHERKGDRDRMRSLMPASLSP